MPRLRSRLVLAAASVPVLALLSCSAPPPAPATGTTAGTQLTQGADHGGFTGTVLDQPYPEPTATFTDANGQTFSFAEDATRPVVLVFFGYTSCPDVCSAVLADIASALRPLDPGTRRRIEVLFITTDPERDTGPVMRAYLQRFDPTFIGLTAPMAETTQVAESLGVAITGHEPTRNGYTVGHGAQILGFGPNRQAGVIWLPGTQVADLRADLVRLASSA